MDKNVQKITERSYEMKTKSTEDKETRSENIEENSNVTEETLEEKETGDIAVGLTVASNILQDGSKTIYSKKAKIVKKSGINVEQLAKNDVKGAITGAIAGGIGGVFAGPVGPVVVAAGAIGGAVVGSVDASFDQLWNKLFHRSNY